MKQWAFLLLLLIFDRQILVFVNSITPFPSQVTRVIVPSVYREWDNHGKPDWATEDMQRKFNYSVFLYQKTNASAPNYIPTNRGTEGGVFLKYIVDHYHKFPDIAIFVHAVPEKHSPNWLDKINCIRPNATYFNFNDEWIKRNVMQWKERSVWIEQCWRDVLKVVWNLPVTEDLLKTVPITKPITIKAACCQQFIMSRSLVLARPLAVWKKLHQMIGVSDVCHKGELEHHYLHAVQVYKAFKAPPESRANKKDNSYGQLVQGFTMEHLAHVVFGQQPLMMSDPDMTELCSHFLDEGQCPGSPCIEKLIVSETSKAV